MAAIVPSDARRRRPDRPTPADLVTAGRGLLVLSCAALVVHGLLVEGSARSWWVCGLAAAAWTLDGVDGHVARRTGTASAHGARLDSAVDGMLVLVLSAALAPVVPWVLLGGLLYPVFLLVQVWRPRWRRPLPRGRRGRLIGGMLTVTLFLGVAPPWPDLVVQVTLVLPVTLVTWSFLVDVRQLERAGTGAMR